MTADDYDEAIRNGIVAFFAKYLTEPVLERIIAERSQQGGATVHNLDAARGGGRAPAAGGRSDDGRRDDDDRGRSGARSDSRGGGYGKPLTSSQVQRLEKIRDVKKLWSIIDDRCPDRKVERFDELSYDEAQAALDTFYEGSGGGRPASAGRR